MAAAYTPHMPSLHTDEWLHRHGARMGVAFACPVCSSPELTATVTHKYDQWPVFTCSACPIVPTIHDLAAVWPVLESDCDQSVSTKPGMITPGDPAFTPQVSVISLGYDEEMNCYLQNSLTGHIVKLKGAQLDEKHLTTVTPDYEYWYWAYGKSGSVDVDWKRCARTIIAECHMRGRFALEDMRGGGVWLDDGRVVANMGTYLLVDGERQNIQGFSSIYIYDSMIKAIRLPEPLSAERAALLPSLLKRLPFIDGTGPIAIGGMTVIGLICGVLGWRPHLWVTGAAESGKSQTLRHTVSRIWKATGATITDESTTAAGVRQRGLRHSAVPVVMDESETDDVNGLHRVKAIVKMARSASTDSDAVVLKGSVTGSGMEFNVRSCFVLCSIVESLTTPQDRQRFTVVHCEKTPSSVENWPSLKADLEATITPEYGVSLYAAVIRDTRLIMDNIKTANARLFTLMGNDSRRHSEQLGTLIAGYFYLIHQGCEITDEWVDTLYHEMNYKEIYADISNEDDTPRRCLNFIYSFKPLSQTMTTGECVERVIEASKNGASGFFSEGYKGARAQLLRTGVDVALSHDPNVPHKLVIASKHPDLTDILERRGFSSHAKLLRRLKGVMAGKTRRFAGVNSHSIEIPLIEPFWGSSDASGADAEEQNERGRHTLADLFDSEPQGQGEEW